jgi:NAD-dependent deacetylase
VIDEVIDIIRKAQSICVLIGAGLSADSGLPTFRGEDGYWKIGSKNYIPEELATFQSFRKMPLEIWKWYSYRRKLYSEAQVNPGHMALVKFHQWAKSMNKTVSMITQNVDGLNLRSYKDEIDKYLPEIYQIHGNIFYDRCSNVSCVKSYQPKKVEIYQVEREEEIIKCSECGDYLRPHVLWFDEIYNDVLFSAQEAFDAAIESDVLLVIGTSLNTTLPYQIVSYSVQSGKAIVEINKVCILGNYTEYTFTGSASEILPEIIEKL